MQKTILMRIKVFVLLWCMFCMSAAVMHVQANELSEEEKWQTVISDDGMIELALPEDWIVFTQETIPDEELCDEIGLYRDELISYVASMDGGMVAFRLSDNAGISVAREPLSGLPDFRSLTSEELEIVVEEARNEVESAEGARRVEYSHLYEGQTDPYIVYKIYDSTTDEILFVTYQTIIGQESISVLFEGTEDFLDNHDFQEKAVDNMVYNMTEHTLEDTKIDIVADMSREVGRTFGSLVISAIIGFAIAGIIVACVNSAKKKRTP